MGVYADINGDGAIDRASAVVGHAGQMHREGHTFEAEEGVHCSGGCADLREITETRRSYLLK